MQGFSNDTSKTAIRRHCFYQGPVLYALHSFNLIQNVLFCKKFDVHRLRMNNFKLDSQKVIGESFCLESVLLNQLNDKRTAF